MGPWVVILLLVVLVASAGGHGGSGGPPLDPASTSPPGAKALALLLDRLGARVDETAAPPSPGSGGTVLVLQDRLEPGGRRQLLEWVDSGGTLVAADPALVVGLAAAARQPGAGGLVVASSPLAAGCGSPAVAGVSLVDPADGLALRPPPGGTGCFDVPGGGSFMVVVPRGRGTVVLLGGPALWTNAKLGKLDNSVLAANLLAPRPGSVVRWIVGGRAGNGRRTLLQLIPPRVKELLLQLLVAMALLALWRGRRLGRPVLETQPVELPGSELVVAVGNLLQQGRRVDDAAALLRASLVRNLAEQTGFPAGGPPEPLAAAVAARSGLAPSAILSTMAGPPPVDEAGLVSLAQAADHIRQEMAHVH